MSAKLLVIVLLIGGVLLAGLGVTVKILYDDNKLLSADLASKTRELKETKGDLAISKQNADRMLAEKDIAIDAAQDRANDQIERAGKFASIKQDIAHAPPPPNAAIACTDSPAVDAALRGLRNAQGAADRGLPADGRVQARQSPGQPPEVQKPAGHP